ncbi:MAG: hypothetical protein DMG22_10505 [Acidobacteria bacterium]|nr:MAG: hypothetical protein DMG22_10505 [Acidobacteriota bacterium]
MEGTRQAVLRFKLGAVLGAALTIGLMAVPSARAQVLYGTLVGHVTDPNGAAVPGAKVHLTNQGTGVSLVALTDSAGDFTFTDVVGGPYTLQLVREGFQTFERKDIPVTNNAVARVDVGLTIGAVTQTVEVTSAAPLLQTDTSEVHANVDAPVLEQLPVPLGRNYQQVYRALPGFSPPSNSHSIPTNPSRSLAFNVNGTSNNQNNTRIDGVSTYNVQLPHVASYVPSLESIQEVNVVTDSFDAEQGFAGGAAINVETKSGTNQIHGSLFEYHSNNHTAAWPMLFDNAAANVGNKPKLVFNQFGGAVGGPIKKDKLFFFSSYEGTLNHRTLQAFASVLTPAMRAGDFSGGLGDFDCFQSDGSIQTSSSPGCPSAAAGTTIAPVMVTTTEGTSVQAQDGMIFNPNTGDPASALGRQVYSCGGAINVIAPCNTLDPIAQIMLDPAQFVALPNRSGARRNLFVSGPFHFHRNQVDNKIDLYASDKLRFIGTFGFLHYDSLAPTRLGPALGNVMSGSGGTSNPGHGHGNTYRTTIMGTYTFSPNFLMDAHFGYAKQGTASEQPFLGKNIGLDTLGIPGTNGTRRFESGWPEFDIDSFDTIGIDSNFMPYFRQDPQNQYVVNFNWIKNKHNLRFGSDLAREALNHTQAEFLSAAFGAQGGFDFNRGVTTSCLPVPGAVNADNSCNFVSADSRYNSAASFVLGLSDFRGKAFQVPDVYHIHAWLYSAYLRDRWTYSPRLTFDYGLRWEHYPVPARPDRGIERYDPDPASATFNKVLVCGVGTVPKDCGIEVSSRLFAPRVGFAYRATDTFVVRGGYGITYDPYFGLESLRNNYPVMVQLNQSNPLGGFFPVGSLGQGLPAIPTPVIPSNGVIDIAGDVGFSGWPKKFDRGYVQSWNLTLQKQLRWGFTGQVGYVATRQVREMGFFNLNSGQVVGAGSAGEPLFAETGGFANPNARTAATIELRPFGSGHYDSLQASLQRRYTKGLALTVNYTWGKAIDQVDNSDENPGDDDGRLQVLSLLKFNRALAGYDRTHNLEIYHVWDLPFGTGQRWLAGGGVLSKVAGGWQLSGLASFITGSPFTVYSSGSGFDTPGSNQTADQVKAHVSKLGSVDPGLPFYDPLAFGDVNAARLGTSGFNILRGPGIANYDFGVYRRFKLSERYNLEFRMESFNFTNTPHFDVPDNFVSDGLPAGFPGGSSDGSFMTVTGTINLAREGLDQRQFEFALRLFF